MLALLFNLLALAHLKTSRVVKRAPVSFAARNKWNNDVTPLRFRCGRTSCHQGVVSRYTVHPCRWLARIGEHSDASTRDCGRSCRLIDNEYGKRAVMDEKQEREN